MGPRAGMLFLLLVMMFGCCVGEEEAEEMDVLFGDQEDNEGSCSQYCDGTYPEHTYPVPEDHLACSRGCRLAVMDALIAWPFSPSTISCLITCEEAYGYDDRQLFACKFGCNTTTIDQQVPDRDRMLYQDLSVNISEEDILMDFFWEFRNQIAQFAFFTDEVSELTEQAEKMYQLLPCGGSSSTIIILQEDGEAMEIQYGFSFNSSPSILYDSIDTNEEGSYSSEVTSYHLSCPWHYSTAGKLLLLVTLGLIALALCTCCCSTFSSEGAEGSRRAKTSVKLVGGEVYALKSPVKYSPGYPQPIPYYQDKKSNHY